MLAPFRKKEEMEEGREEKRERGNEEGRQAAQSDLCVLVLASFTTPAFFPYIQFCVPKIT
jgi:hypothetical protein